MRWQWQNVTLAVSNVAYFRKMDQYYSLPKLEIIIIKALFFIYIQWKHFFILYFISNINITLRNEFRHLFTSQTACEQTSIQARNRFNFVSSKSSNQKGTMLFEYHVLPWELLREHIQASWCISPVQMHFGRTLRSIVHRSFTFVYFKDSYFNLHKFFSKFICLSRHVIQACIVDCLF